VGRTGPFDLLSNFRSIPALDGVSQPIPLKKDACMTSARCAVALLVSLLLLSLCGFAQVTTGTPPLGSFGGGPFDIVNEANLNVHFAIPVIHKAGRACHLRDWRFEQPQSRNHGRSSHVALDVWSRRGGTSIF
jgi:hypothetical protein